MNFGRIIIIVFHSSNFYWQGKMKLRFPFEDTMSKNIVSVYGFLEFSFLYRINIEVVINIRMCDIFWWVGMEHFIIKKCRLYEKL